MGASAWHGLVGTAGYAAGAAGTVTLPPNAIILAIVAHASSTGSFSIFGGASIPIPAGVLFNVDFKHTLFAVSGTGTSAQLTFTGTDSYFVHYVRQGHAS